jgi:hypothetical protein
MEQSNSGAVLWLRRGMTAEMRHWQDSVVAQLETAAARSDVSVDVNRWSRKVETSANARRVEGDAAALDAYRRYSLWADRADVSLEPAFQTYWDECTFTDKSCEVILFPVICLALYEEDGLIAVYPHVRDDEVVTVADGLDLIAHVPADKPLAAELPS